MDPGPDILHYSRFHNTATGHSFARARFRLPSRCAACAKVIWNVKDDAVRCLTCQLPAHRGCVMAAALPACEGEPEPGPERGELTAAQRFMRVGLPLVAGTVVGGVLGGPVGAATGAATGAKILGPAAAGIGFAKVAGAGVGAFGANRWRARRDGLAAGEEAPLWGELHAAFLRQLLESPGPPAAAPADEEQDGLRSSQAARSAARGQWTESERAFFARLDPAAPDADAIAAFVAQAVGSPVHAVGRFRAALAEAFEGRPEAAALADAHAVVNRLALAVLQAYPPLQDSPEATRASNAAAREAAFAVVYDAAFAAVERLCAAEDAELRERLEYSRRAAGHADDARLRGALDQLQRLPGMRSAAGKMRCLTRALEEVSAVAGRDSGEAPGADALIPLVCRAVALADLAHPATELTFVMEFGDADVLLRGRDGYSVTTFQAALHVVLSPELVELF